MVHHLTKVIGLMQCLYVAKFQLLANVHSRTFINLVLFVLWLWRFVIYYLTKDISDGFLLWIVTCFYELSHAWNACHHSFVHAVPMGYNSKSHPSSFLSPGPTHAFILLCEALLTSLVLFLTQKIIIRCLLYVITAIDSRHSTVSKTGTVHVLWLIWKKIKGNII